MGAPTAHFLLVYSHREQRLLSQDEFKESGRATKAYAEAESKYRGEEQYEIVLIGSDSIETIMKTHGHYFASNDQELFGGLLAS